jgi:thiol-disulfide isomerase/thioredoxin
MVNVWSPGCPHCVRELPTLIKFHADNAAGARVIGIAVDYPGFGAADPVALARFVADHGINFPNLAAGGASVSVFLGETVDLVPVTYAYDPGGRLVARWHGVITERDILEIIRDFSPAAQ